MELDNINKQPQMDIVSNIIQSKAQNSTDVKEVIDLATTKTAVAQDDTMQKLVDEKTTELANDAERKRIEAEKKKIEEEVAKVRVEAEKEIAGLEKSINAKKAEYEELVAQDHKADAYFEAHKSILRCIGIREKLSVSAMQKWLVPASAIYFVFQILLLPLTLISFALEQLINIVGTISEKISKTGWKIAVSIVSIIVIVALLFGAYYGGSYAISHLIQ